MRQVYRDDPIDTHELAVSNMIGIEAFVGLLVKKGIVSMDEIPAELQAVREDMTQKARTPQKEQ